MKGLSFLLALVVLLALGAAVHLYLLDGLEGALLSLAFDEDTVYAESYSDSAFRRITSGISESQLIELLGPPLGEVWIYGPPGQSDMVGFSGDHVDHVHEFAGGENNFGKLMEGMSKVEVDKVVGQPLEKSFVYSKSQHDRSYRVRVVILSNGLVERESSYFYVD